MEHDLILRNEDIHRLNVVLTRLIDKGRIDCSMIVNKSGRLMTSQSESSEFDKTSLAALVAGSFASTISIANLIGENAFQTMVHQGKKKSTYVAQIDDSTILTHIFTSRTTFDRVKTVTKEFIPELQSLLAILYAEMQSDPNINMDVGHS
jgi:predicted regulator of Ras-like GTPase activity (Roadblock/LC7/MglB family)